MREARQANLLQGVRIYDFDAEYRLRQMTSAKRGEYRDKGVWRLLDVAQTQLRGRRPAHRALRRDANGARR